MKCASTENVEKLETRARLVSWSCVPDFGITAELEEWRSLLLFRVQEMLRSWKLY